MNSTIDHNFSKLKPSLFIAPVLILISIILLLYKQDALNKDAYAHIQKDYFIAINSYLSQFPQFEYNLTQIGDAFIFLSFLSIFLVYAPLLWEALITVSFVSLIFAQGLKHFFSVPRPAAVFDNNSFIIIGEKLTGHNSLPSGHSITVFTLLTVILFAFMPSKNSYRSAWIGLIILAGLFIALTRVGVGAHYPLDVIVGSTIGYIAGLTGIFVSKKYKLWTWIHNQKYHPVLIAILLTGCLFLVNKIIQLQLPIFYMALLCLIFSLYNITNAYLGKKI